jgi:hypothetical protein
MDIFILIAIIVAGASGLYVALKFDTRTQKSITKYVHPLIESTAKSISEKIDASSEAGKKDDAALRNLIQGIPCQQQEAIDNGLGRQAEKIITELREATGSELRQQVQKLVAELRQERELVQHLVDALGAHQDQLRKDLAQMDNRVAQLGDSLAWQGAQLTDICRHTSSQGNLAGISPEAIPLALAMLEAESHADRLGWGTSPQLYALTATISLVTADHRPLAEMRYARPDRLILAAHQSLPRDGLIEALADIRWPGDVVGCVLIAEFTDLPARGEEAAPLDPDAGAQWANPHPDGRPARLAAGVRRSGEHLCAFRSKGDNDFQIRNEMAGDIVTALLGTF